ncbi:MAG: cytochrome c [Candidatus Acidiferrales bacterium]
MPPKARELKNPVPSNPATLATAREIYTQNCEKCHGVNGDGKRPPGSMYSYNTQPTNFTNAKLMDAMSDGEIYWKMSEGRKPMPSFRKRLTDEQRWELVDLLRAFAHPASSPAEK